MLPRYGPRAGRITGMILFSTPERSGDVQQVLRQASNTTGVDYDYLLQTAQRESGLDPGATARTSSARGLFQFIESTWMATLKASGARHGYGELAAQIERTTDGGYQVADPQARQQVLALRHDPKAAALMAGELTRDNSAMLQKALGRAPSGGELYMAHFLGVRGAAELLRLEETAPQSAAAEHFPAAARANQTIFYAEDGRARPVGEVKARLMAQHDSGQLGQKMDATNPAMPPAADRQGDIFHGMFSSGRGGGGLGPLAKSAGSFWTGLYGSAESRADAGSTAHATSRGDPLGELFRDSSGRDGR